MIQLLLILCLVISFLKIAYEIRKKRLSFKDSIFWLIYVGAVMCLVLFPPLLNIIKNYIGISNDLSIISVIFTPFILFTQFNNSRIINEYQTKIDDLTSEIVILKSKIK